MTPDFTTSQRYHTEPVHYSLIQCARLLYDGEDNRLSCTLNDLPRYRLVWGQTGEFSETGSILLTPGQFIDALIELKRKQQLP